MEQRPLRLGDHVDDYCPRERRVTNHVIVALVEDAIRQTRCTTCDADHVYKGAKEPRRRKTDPKPFDTVQAESTNGSTVASPQLTRPEEPSLPATAETNGSGLAAAPESESQNGEENAQPAPPSPSEEPWSLHRRLIRASLPRNGDDPPPPRPIPEFTMHQRPPQGRGRQFRSHGHGGHGSGFGGFGGNRSHGHGNDGNSSGQGRSGNGSGRHGRHRGKRSR